MEKDPNPLATGPTKWRAEHCTTHHHACDCREWEHANRVAELERDAERYRWLRKHGRYSSALMRWHEDMGLVLKLELHLDAAIDAAMNGANA